MSRRLCSWSKFGSSYRCSWGNIELNNPVWDVQAYYIAQAAVNATVTFRPDVIVFGGGVMAQQHMLDRVREKFTSLLNGYLPVPECAWIHRDTSSRRKWFCYSWKLCSCKRSFKIKHKIRLGNQTDFVVENNIFELFLKVITDGSDFLRNSIPKLWA